MGDRPGGRLSRERACHHEAVNPNTLLSRPTGRPGVNGLYEAADHLGERSRACGPSSAPEMMSAGTAARTFGSGQSTPVDRRPGPPWFQHQKLGRSTDEGVVLDRLSGLFASGRRASRSPGQAWRGSMPGVVRLLAHDVGEMHGEACAAEDL